MPQVTAAGQPDALAIFNAADTNANEPPDRTEGIIHAANTGAKQSPHYGVHLYELFEICGGNPPCQARLSVACHRA